MLRHFIPRNDGRIFAFTLAEVLITLTIIGVIAALTIPNLMHKYKMKELEALYKKGYNNLYDLNQKFKQDTDFDICEYAREYGTSAISNYMIEKMGAKQISNAYIYTLKTLTGLNHTNGLFDDGKAIHFNNQNYYFEYNGTIAHSQTGKCPIITVDFNGYKAPNKWGYDTFSFYPRENNQIIPVGSTVDRFTIGHSGYNSFIQSSTYCSYTSTDTKNGVGCAYWASINKAPDGTDKTYWEWLRF